MRGRGPGARKALLGRVVCVEGQGFGTVVAARRNRTRGWGPATVDFVAGGALMVQLQLGGARDGAEVRAAL